MTSSSGKRELVGKNEFVSFGKSVKKAKKFDSDAESCALGMCFKINL